MTPMSTRPAELALPAAAFASLRDAITAHLDADTAADVLRNAGHDAGDAFFHLLSSDGDAELGRASLARLDPASFWRRFAQLFATRGWGNLTHADVHPGVA